MRASGSSHGSVLLGRCLWVKVNLPIFKDEKMRDAVTYCSWWLDVVIFCWSGWDDQPLLPYTFCSLQGFLGDLAQNVGKDVVLNDVLQILYEHYGVVMTFDALRKELYSIKQGLRENVAEYRVLLLQQFQIIKSEYMGRIWPERVEEMKHDCFYEGLNPKYQWMLANKVDSKNPAGYSDLLLATWKLKRRAKPRDPLPTKTAVTSGSNTIHSQTPGNLFPSHKLKGNCTFTTWAVTIESVKGKADSSTKQKEEGEMEPSADEEFKVLGRAEETDQPMEYIIHFTKAVDLYLQKNRSCFSCGSPNHLMRDCPKDISKNVWKADFNTKEGMAKNGDWAPQKSAVAQTASLEETCQT